MKIKVEKKTLAEVRALPAPPRRKPVRPARLWRWVMKTAGAGDLKDAQFSYTLKGLDRIPDEPCLVVMNHSSFIDLEIAAKILYPHPFNIVCTSDGFVGKDALMSRIGCIPTNKFVTDVGLIVDMSYALHERKDHVLLYPEASYTFDCCATTLPARMGVLVKKLKVPVLFIKTDGAFLRDPLYNCLQKRKVKV
ncbi:MAG: 1-acyl-sn-glycerol-3-phosphate acyltransferase, partial [Firmicutes bacterium]|nr:1-acyl-sn-glycerol-3-phosphate acyltransferase [Bacillota bacterium]